MPRPLPMRSNSTPRSPGDDGSSDKRRPAPKPPWIKVSLRTSPEQGRIRSLLRQHNLHTVCEESFCPNIHECWSGGTATFMILGDVCTRACRFCAVQSGNPGGVLDPDEPEHLAATVSQLGLKYVVITAVDRDDLPDQGADHFARCVRGLRQSDRGLLVEVLSGDFQGDRACVETVVEAAPHVFAHNIETVERLQPEIRDRRAGYHQSLQVLRHARRVAPDVLTKSSIQLGHGETDGEVMATLRDLRGVGTDIVTFGQYLQPTPWHRPVNRWPTPEEFDTWADRARDLGFRAVASGPLVRSSYRAGELFVREIQGQQAAAHGRDHASRLENVI